MCFPVLLTVRYCLLSHSGSDCKSVDVLTRADAAAVAQVKRKERTEEKKGEREVGKWRGAAVRGQ